MFNRDIEKLVQGEEIVKEKDTRLYNKLREEFQNWILILSNNTQQGKSQDRAAPKSSVLRVYQDQRLVLTHQKCVKS